MKDYQQLTCEQRYQIYGLQKAGFKPREIANEVGVNKSTISRELRRNRGQQGWHPKQAQELRDKRIRQQAQARRFSREDWNKVERMIRQDVSPEQVSARLKLEDELSISANSNGLTPSLSILLDCAGAVVRKNTRRSVEIIKNLN